MSRLVRMRSCLWKIELLIQILGGTSIFKEFKEFAMRGNVLDMTVGDIIGAAFVKIVTSLVQDILMPPIGMLMGGAEFTNYFVTLSGQTLPTLAAAKEAGAPTINYGVFLNSVLDFLIVAFAVFLIVRQINKLRRKKELAPAASVMQKECPPCLSSIPIDARRCAYCTSQLVSA